MADLDKRANPLHARDDHVYVRASWRDVESEREGGGGLKEGVRSESKCRCALYSPQRRSDVAVRSSVHPTRNDDRVSALPYLRYLGEG